MKTKLKELLDKIIDFKNEANDDEFMGFVGDFAELENDVKELIFSIGE